MISAAELEAVLLGAIDREPDSEVVDRPDWVQVRCPSSPRPSHNQILRARVSDSDLPQVVEDVVADHTARGATHRWVVAPSSSPALAERLPEFGYDVMGCTSGMAMAVPIEDRPLAVEGLTVVPVGVEDVDAFAELTRVAWERDAAFSEAAAFIARKLIPSPVPVWFWTALIDGEPVATCNLRRMGGLGYFQGCAVRREFRGRGVYRALIDFRLAFMRAAGMQHAVVWADADTSAHACASAGFASVCSAMFFRREP